MKRHFVGNGAAALATMALVGSSTILVAGWLFGHDAFIRGGREQFGTTPMTALCLAMVSLSIVLRFLPGQSQDLRAALLTSAAVIALANIGLRLVVTDDWAKMFMSNLFGTPDRMAYGTSLATVMLCVTGLMLQNPNDRLSPVLAIGLPLFGASFATSALLGQSFERTASIKIPLCEEMSAYTATLLLLLFLALAGQAGEAETI